MKKSLLGLLWTGVFYILLWVLFAIIYYFYAGGDYSSFDEGYSHGTEFGAKLGEMGGRIFIFIISGILAGILTYKGMLPGTKAKNTFASESKKENNLNINHRICTQCSTALPLNLKYCIKCGTKL